MGDECRGASDEGKSKITRDEGRGASDKWEERKGSRDEWRGGKKKVISDQVIGNQKEKSSNEK